MHKCVHFQVFFGPPPSSSSSSSSNGEGEYQGGGGGDDRALHLPSYVEALTCVVRHSPSVSPAAAAAFERIVVHLVATFPRLPKQYHRWNFVEVFWDFSYSINGFVSLTDFPFWH